MLQSKFLSPLLKLDSLPARWYLGIIDLPHSSYLCLPQTVKLVC